MAQTLDVKFKTRKYLRGQVTRIFNERSSFSTLNVTERTAKRSKLLSFSNDLKILNSEIQVLKFSTEFAEAELESELHKCIEYEDKILECVAILDSLKVPNLNCDKRLLNAPSAPLPVFKGNEDESLAKFLNLFDETINRYNYAEHDKFLLLKQQLSGRALILIDSLESNKQSYDCAVALLKSAFDSRSIQVSNTIKQLSQMKLTYNQDPFEYISMMRKITEAVDLHKITSKEFLNYFFWSGLNDLFKEELVKITNKTHPSLDDINDHFFTASERYRDLQVKLKNRKSKQFKGNDKIKPEQVNMAIAVESKQKEIKDEGKVVDHKVRLCILCMATNEGVDHPIYRCPVFADPISKLKKLAELKGCTKCGQINHIESKCNFRFKKKCNCGNWHFNFLCAKVKGKNEIPSHSNLAKDNSSVLNTNSNIIDCFLNVGNSDSILPTFSCIANNRYQIRGLKDEGSQCNFIVESLAKELDLETVTDNVLVKVHGFNTPQQYISRVVKLSINCGDQDRIIDAICVPEIKINIKLPKLSCIAKQFVNKGYKLADKKLYESINGIRNLDFILGSNSAYCLKSHEISFGLNHGSIYADTSAGIMLIGNIESNLRDLPYLPDKLNPKNVANDSNVMINPVSQCLAVESESFKDNENYLNTIETSANFLVFNEDEKVNRMELERATNDILKSSFYTHETYDDNTSDLNKDLIKFALDNTSRSDDGRLTMPILWRNDVSHLLGNNFKLAKAVLESNAKKLKKKPSYFSLMDESFKEQVELGILERIPDVEMFRQENPKCSFLAHMGVFKPNRDTTKCRVVYLSNLSGNDSGFPLTVTHNQAMHSGPSLNQSISTAILHLRFDHNLLIFDIKKAFNMISLSREDSSKLACLWYKDVSNNDFSMVCYINKRLPFGLRCSPTLLMLGLYKILVMDTEMDSPFIKKLKLLIYQCMYMDNGALTTNDENELIESYEQLNKIFNPYKFEIQQVQTNNIKLQSKIDESNPTPDTVKLLGLIWNRVTDTLSTKPLELNKHANTKRLILKSIAEQYDNYHFNAPLLNRARLFMHDLQCDKNLSWDSKLDEKLCKQWQNIVIQANKSDVIEIPRMLGNREDIYNLIACTDASTKIYGVVVYAHNVNTNQITYILSKNRIMNKQLESKTVPSLELHAISLGCETLIEVYKGLAGPECTVPIKIEKLSIFSDSLVALSWVNDYANKFDKMNKKTVFVLNRIKQIVKACDVHPINFGFISGIDNPADMVTRCISSKLLKRSNYISGPKFIVEELDSQSLNSLSFMVPNPNVRNDNLFHDACSNFDENEIFEPNSSTCVNFSQTEAYPDPLIDPGQYSSFSKLIRVHAKVLQFIDILRYKVNLKNNKIPNMTRKGLPELTDMATTQIISNLQHHSFPEIYNYFDNPQKTLKDIPNLVNKLNVYVDKTGLLRVKSKFGRWENNRPYTFPLLLPKNSLVTKIIILDLHKKFNHAGCYTILSELRKRFWLPHCFSIVKRILKECITCKRFNAKPIQCNQNAYKEWRVEPPNIPYSYVFMDYIGPFEVKENKVKKKVWILCLTCLWSRAVNLKMCYDFSVAEFLRAFQLHCFEWGLPMFCMSDLGSQIVAGSKIIRDFLKDSETQIYFAEKGVKPITFQQFAKGKSELGSLVESCVKQVKKLIYSSIRKNVLEMKQFDFLVHEITHLINRRPVAFKEGLGDINMPSPITPELITKGYELMSINVIPELQPVDLDPEWSSDSSLSINDNYCKLRNIRKILKEKYRDEFLVNLISQATDIKGRYKPKLHKPLKIGDIVLIKDENTKSYNLPLGIVKQIEVNSLGEVTNALLKKGKTGELTIRHVTNLIPMLSESDVNMSDFSIELNSDQSNEQVNKVRLAATKANERIKLLADTNSI